MMENEDIQERLDDIKVILDDYDVWEHDQENIFNLIQEIISVVRGK